MNLPDFKDLKSEMDRAKHELILLKKKDDEISKRKQLDVKYWYILFVIYYILSAIIVNYSTSRYFNGLEITIFCYFHLTYTLLILLFYLL